MIALLVSLEIRTNLSKPLGYDVTRRSCREVVPPASECGRDPEQAAADFITRHVLEKDAICFGG